MHARQIFDIADQCFFVGVEYSHRTVAEMCNVESSGVWVEALIVEARRAPAQRNVTQSTKRKIA